MTSFKVPSCSAAFCLLTMLLAAPTLAADLAPSVVGWLSIVWGDSQPGAVIATPRRILLTDEQGVSRELSMSFELLRGGVARWDGRRVRVFPRLAAQAAAGEQHFDVAAIRLLGETDARGVVSGSQPWVSLLCKFSDVATEPRDQGFFNGMYANAPGGLDHFWREVSAGQIDIIGSTAIDWVALPGTHNSYVPTPGSGTNANLNLIFNDCTAAADPFVDFSGGGNPFAGINIMLNGLLDCCAWGGSRFATLDGVAKTWRTTWEPPWGYADEGVIAHEMGHGFGLPHANNFDGDSNPYDSPWDVMSSATSYSVVDGTYGRLGKHVNAYHKDSLGWFAPARRFEPPADSSTEILLDRTSLIGASNFQLVRIAIDSSHWYTVEARLRGGDYEAALVGDAVIIHQVVVGRSEPSWAVDDADPPANFGDNAGTMWTVGETFVDAAASISVSVDFATATGFGITVNTGTVGKIFEDGFESNSTSEWTSVSP